MDRENSFLNNPYASYKRDSLSLAISIVVPLMASAIGVIFTSESISTWYQTIEKPSFTPPNWLFGPVWTTLYILMGISFFLIWRATSATTFQENRRSRKIVAFTAFGTQLILNALWSFLFFGLRSPQLAFAEIVILLISIVVTIVIFSKIFKLAAVLLCCPMPDGSLLHLSLTCRYGCSIPPSAFKNSIYYCKRSARLVIPVVEWSKRWLQ